MNGLLETVKKSATVADYEPDTGTHVLHSVTPLKRTSRKSAASLYDLTHCSYCVPYMTVILNMLGGRTAASHCSIFMEE